MIAKPPRPERVFGLEPTERLRRQGAFQPGEFLFVASPAAVLGDSAVSWLRHHPQTLLTAASGAPLAIVVPSHEREQAERAISGAPHPYPVIKGGAGPQIFNRKLRRREKLLGLSLDDSPAAEVEQILFDSVYKGVTDLVTKYVWPLPAFWVTRGLASLGTAPNLVTFASILLVFITAWLFFKGDLAPALATAWLMTFLDTVDGKLARVTATSSRLGDVLDHGTDLIHPPLWWICLAIGVGEPGGQAVGLLMPACAAILACYVVGRLVEGVFKKALGFNQYIWRPFDSAFRLVVARRNTILLIMTIGLAAPSWAYLAAAGWSAVSVTIQIVCLVQGLAAKSVKPWLADGADEVAEVNTR